MSRQDPSEARGMVLHGDPARRCTTAGCGDLEAVHLPKADGGRGKCSAAFCRCTTFTPRKETP
jgi:hypothetical protein